MERAHIPALIFINKTDRVGADVGRTVAQARRRLSPGIFLMSDPEEAMAAIAEHDEQAMLDYMDGTIYNEETRTSSLVGLTRSCALYPALAGSALKDEGIEPLLNAVVDLLPPPGGDASADVCGVVFDVEQDAVMGLGAHVRLFSGTLENRQSVQLPVRHVSAYSERLVPEERKITQIRRLGVDGRSTDIGRLTAGDIGLVYGLNGARVGTVIGNEQLLPRPVTTGALREPLMMVSVNPASP